MAKGEVVVVNGSYGLRILALQDEQALSEPRLALMRWFSK